MIDILGHILTNSAQRSTSFSNDRVIEMQLDKYFCFSNNKDSPYINIQEMKRPCLYQFQIMIIFEFLPIP